MGNEDYIFTILDQRELDFDRSRMLYKYNWLFSTVGIHNRNDRLFKDVYRLVLAVL